MTRSADLNHAWNARTKRELMIEVWEALDCESVGADELMAIETVVRDRFGDGAVASHASVARILADEGAELRHPEVIELDVKQRSFDPYAELFRNVKDMSTLDHAATTIGEMERLRIKFASEDDRQGLRRLRDLALKLKRRALAVSGNERVREQKRVEKAEIAEWLTVWLRQPELFDTWLEIRRRTMKNEK